MTREASSRPFAIATVASREFLPFARVLVKSLRRFHPRVPVFIAVADGPPDLVDGMGDQVYGIAIDALPWPDFDAVQSRYTFPQLVIAAKAFLLCHVIESGFERAWFLDSDVLVLGALDDLMRTAVAHDVLLTPHLLAATGGPSGAARELNILQSGIFNGGFIGVSDRPASRAFLQWWCDRLATDCRHDLAAGVHNDQRWLDVVPAWFEGVHVVRDPGCNVAYWNLPERRLSIEGERVLVNGAPARFFHFSGYEPQHPDVVTRYSTRLSMATVGPAADLFTRYQQELVLAGWRPALDS